MANDPGLGAGVLLPTRPDYETYLKKKYMVGDQYINQGVNGIPAVTTTPDNIVGMNPGFISAFGAGIKTPDEKTPRNRLFTRENMNKAAAGISAATPYLSNLLNSIRKPPRPAQPISDSYVNLSKVNLDNQRQEVRMGTHVANTSADRNVDANTAEAIKAFNHGKEFENLSNISERETNTNVGIQNQQAALDMQTNFSNVDKANNFNQALTAMDIANQRERSENVANLGNKLVLEQNEKRKEKTELAKARVLRTMYNQSGVLSRDNAMGEEWKKAGLPDPFGEDYGWLDNKKQNSSKKANGGFLKLGGAMYGC